MKAWSFKRLYMFVALIFLASSCGRPEASSSVKSDVHDACVAAARAEQTKAYDQAAKTFDAAASACYAVLDDQQYLSVSLCLKKAESARQQSLVDADSAWNAAMSVCEPR